jgi:D-hydroxyproline dehydrogenase subunit beta
MDRSTEVLIVGAGVVGSATAYYLAKAGAKVTVLDEHEPGWGASGRNPGFVWLHTRAEGIQMTFGLAGRALYDELVPELDDFEFRRSGGMVYFFEEQATIFPNFVRNRQEAGLPMELLSADAAREACPILPEEIGGATYNPLDAHVNPEKLVNALAAAASWAGAKFVPHAKVSHLDVSGGRCHGAAANGESYKADVVVVAAGSWSPQVLEPLGLNLPIVPMRLQMVETAAIDLTFDPILYGPTGVKQYALAKDVEGYLEEAFTHPLETVVPGMELLELAAQRKNGKVLLGCPMDFAGYNDQPTVGGLGLTCGVLADHLPALKGISVERTWAGLLPQTPDALPVLGRVAAIEGLSLAAGHVFGMLAGPLSGKLVAQELLNQPTDLELAPFRFERESISEALESLRHW